MKRLIRHIAMAGVVVGFASWANATPSLYLDDGLGHHTTISGTGSSVASGSFTLGSWEITSVGGVVSGTTTQPSMDLGTLEVSGTGGGTLTVQLSDTGFGPTTSGGLSLNATGNVGGTATFNTYIDAGNTLFGTSTLVASAGPLTGTFAASASGTYSAGAPYSMTEEVVLGAGSTANLIFSTDGKITVPDGGGTLMLLGATLAGLGLVRRKVMA